jgi:3-methyladenine DNA glycosylase Mpg
MVKEKNLSSNRSSTGRIEIQEEKNSSYRFSKKIRERRFNRSPND